jgi:hypothetical protein
MSAPLSTRVPTNSIHESGAGGLLQCGGQRSVLIAVGAAYLSDPAQVIFCLVAVALLDLPKTVIVPRQDMVRIGFERALIPDLRELVVAELAIGVPDQIGDVRVIVVAERSQLLDGGLIIIAFVNGCIRRTVALGKGWIVGLGALVVDLFLVLKRLVWINWRQIAVRSLSIVVALGWVGDEL